MSKKTIRTCLHPSLMLTFIIMGLTGILMMFHLHAGGIKPLHEWMGVAFLILCVVHLVLNWKAFLVHLKGGPVAASVIGICLLSILLIFSTGGQGKGGHNGRSGQGHYRHIN